MRTAVIGASNSLVRGGVVQGMIDGGLDVVANGSLGHSQSVILPFRLSPSQLGGEQFEHLVVEIATNEQIALRSSLANFDTMRAVLDWTVQWCLERGIGVTFVTMPELASYTHSGDIRAFGVGRFLAGYAASRQIQNFDGYEWLDARAAERGLEPADCFETAAHMNVELSHAFGRRIAESIAAPAGQLRRRLRPTRSFEYVPFTATDGWAAADKLERSTSLGSAELLRLRLGSDAYEVDLPAGAIVGTVHNVAGTNGVLRIDALQSRAKRLDASLGAKLVLTAWGWRTPIPVDGVTTLRADAVAYVPDLEHNHASVWRPPSEKARNRPTAVEVAGLVVSTATA